MKSSYGITVHLLCMLKRSSPRRLSRSYLVLECAELLLNSLEGESVTLVLSAKETVRDAMVAGWWWFQEETYRKVDGLLYNQRIEITRRNRHEFDLLLLCKHSGVQARVGGGREGVGYHKRSNNECLWSRVRSANTFPSHPIGTALTTETSPLSAAHYKP